MTRLTEVRCRGGRGLVLAALGAVTCAALLCLSLRPASANDWLRYWQFRHSSALPGNLFGVSPEGEVGFAGAFQQNVPVAYTPTSGNWVIGGNSGSNTGSIEVGFGGEDVNGTAFLGAGWGKPGRAMYGSWMMTGTDIAESWNLQVQLAPGGGNRWAAAIGVQDLLNERDAYPGDPHSGRSIYGTLTRPLSDPIKGYLTLGWGNGRFNDSPFAGLSVPLGGTLNLVAEYDGMQTNAGLAISGLDVGEHDPDQRWIAMVYLGYSGLERPVVGLTITRH